MYVCVLRYRKALLTPTYTKYHIRHMCSLKVCIECMSWNKPSNSEYCIDFHNSLYRSLSSIVCVLCRNVIMVWFHHFAVGTVRVRMCVIMCKQTEQRIPETGPVITQMYATNGHPHNNQHQRCDTALRCYANINYPKLDKNFRNAERIKQLTKISSSCNEIPKM